MEVHFSDGECLRAPSKVVVLTPQIVRSFKLILGLRKKVLLAHRELLKWWRASAAATWGGMVLLVTSGVTKLTIRAPTSGDPLRPSKSCILKRFSTPYIKPFRRHWSVLG